MEDKQKQKESEERVVCRQCSFLRGEFRSLDELLDSEVLKTIAGSKNSCVKVESHCQVIKTIEKILLRHRLPYQED